MAAVKVKGVVCLQCKERTLSNKPVEMEHTHTMEAEGLEGHLIGSFGCPKCRALIGFIYEPVRVMRDGSTKGIPLEKFKKKGAMYKIFDIEG
jgi:hypothetical protein